MGSTELWTKIGFMIAAFLEALIAGMIPTWSPSCRESPKILGIANSFAGGVFLAIALMHIMPEQIEGWGEYKDEKEPLFPLPELLVFVGYTFILVLDKVLFDTHALFDDHGHGETSNDPAQIKLEVNMKASMAKADRADVNDPAALRKSQVE